MSSSEGFPNVIGEAMIAGLPVITYDCLAGPSEMIKNGINGILVPLHDNAEYEKNFRILLKDEQLRTRLGAQAKITIESDFSLNKIGELYHSVLITNN